MPLVSAVRPFRNRGARRTRNAGVFGVPEELISRLFVKLHHTVPMQGAHLEFRWGCFFGRHYFLAVPGAAISECFLASLSDGIT